MQKLCHDLEIIPLYLVFILDDSLPRVVMSAYSFVFIKLNFSCFPDDWRMEIS